MLLRFTRRKASSPQLVKATLKHYLGDFAGSGVSATPHRLWRGAPWTVSAQGTRDSISCAAYQARQGKASEGSDRHCHLSSAQGGQERLRSFMAYLKMYFRKSRDVSPTAYTYDVHARRNTRQRTGTRRNNVYFIPIPSKDILSRNAPNPRETGWRCCRASATLLDTWIRTFGWHGREPGVCQNEKEGGGPRDKLLRHVRVPARAECVRLDPINWLLLWRTQDLSRRGTVRHNVPKMSVCGAKQHPGCAQAEGDGCPHLCNHSFRATLLAVVLLRPVASLKLRSRSTSVPG